MNSLLLGLLVLAASAAAQHQPEEPPKDKIDYLTQKMDTLFWMFSGVNMPEMSRYVQQLNLTYDKEIGFVPHSLYYSYNNVTHNGKNWPAMGSYFWLLPPSQKLTFGKNPYTTFHIHRLAGDAPVRVYFLNETSEEIYYYDMGDVLLDPNYHMLVQIKPNTYVAFEVLSDSDYALLSVSSSPAEKFEDYQPATYNVLVKEYPHLYRIIDHIYSNKVAGYTFPKFGRRYHSHEYRRKEFNNKYHLYNEKYYDY